MFDFALWFSKCYPEMIKNIVMGIDEYHSYTNEVNSQNKSSTLLFYLISLLLLLWKIMARANF